jgi:hypothetical protein
MVDARVRYLAQAKSLPQTRPYRVLPSFIVGLDGFGGFFSDPIRIARRR